MPRSKHRDRAERRGIKIRRLGHLPGVSEGLRQANLYLDRTFSQPQQSDVRRLLSRSDLETVEYLLGTSADKLSASGLSCRNLVAKLLRSTSLQNSVVPRGLSPSERIES